MARTVNALSEPQHAYGADVIREIDGTPLDPGIWGHKASNLARLRRAGVPVPAAIAFRPSRPTDTTLEMIIEGWLLQHRPLRCVLRSSTEREDSSDRAYAGSSLTLVDLIPSAPALTNLVTTTPEFNFDNGSLILQAQAPCVLAGVAFVDGEITQIEGARDSITATTSGEPPPIRATIRNDQVHIHIEETTSDLPLLAIMHDIRSWCKVAANIFDGHADIEWVHSGFELNIVQARPITRPVGPR